MSAQPNHDPALSAPPQQDAPSTGLPTSSDIASQISIGQLTGLSNLDHTQLLQLLRALPGTLNGATKLTEQGGSKEAAAEVLSNLAQASFPPPYQPLPQQTSAVSEPGPSSHPLGPPNLGQLSTLAAAAEEAGSGGEGGDEDGDTQPERTEAQQKRTRGARSANMGSDEWARQRKDNHKEVERRRRGNINEGINELGRIVPNGSGEKAKGAILSRAVQYIHHLKENEAHNIEKWTLEKLLMDQAMGDLQAQLDEMRRMWEEERAARHKAESDVEALRAGKEGSHGEAKEETERGGKRQRVE